MENNNSLDYLKKITKIKLIVMLLSLLLPIIIVVTMAIGNFKISEGSLFKKEPSLAYIICVLVEAYIVFKVINYVRILKDEDYSQYVLIKQNDERIKYIKLKSNSIVHKIFIYVLCVALLFSAFVSLDSFIFCGSILLAFLIIHIFVHLYYHKKY